MLLHLFVLALAIVIGFPATGRAQFLDKGEHVEVTKGTTLCSNVAIDDLRGRLAQHRIFWKVTSPMRSNGTQTVAALTHEAVYDRKSGDTTIVESRYPDEDYATFFKRAPQLKGVLVMISPQDGTEQATVKLCQKRK